MANQNFRVKTGLEVGTGVTISAGIVTTVNLSSQQINISGVSTFAGITTVTGVTLFAKQLSVSGVSTFQNDVKLGDSDSVYFGDNNNLRIFNDGSNSYILEQGIGNLAILGDSEVWIGNTAASEYKARFITDGAVELYYENVKKFETTGYGATVFGTLQSQGLQVSGVSTITTLQGTTLKNYGETINNIGNTGTAATINLANGNFVTATLTGNCTFTFTTGLSSGAISFTLLLTNDATPSRSIVWPTSVKWPNSSVPVRTTTANATDVYTFFTLNSGTNWYGNLSLYNYT